MDIWLVVCDGIKLVLNVSDIIIQSGFVLGLYNKTKSWILCCNEHQVCLCLNYWLVYIYLFVYIKWKHNSIKEIAGHLLVTGISLFVGMMESSEHFKATLHMNSTFPHTKCVWKWCPKVLNAYHAWFVSFCLSPPPPSAPSPFFPFPFPSHGRLTCARLSLLHNSFFIN